WICRYCPSTPKEPARNSNAWSASDSWTRPNPDCSHSPVSRHSPPPPTSNPDPHQQAKRHKTHLLPSQCSIHHSAELRREIHSHCRLGHRRVRWRDVSGDRGRRLGGDIGGSFTAATLGCSRRSPFRRFGRIAGGRASWLLLHRACRVLLRGMLLSLLGTKDRILVVQRCGSGR